MTDYYPIKNRIEEAECDDCGTLLRMGAVALEEDGLLFCSLDCRAAFWAAEANEGLEKQSLASPVTQSLLFPI